MIINKTPLRISFFGGSTDYPHFVKSHGGLVIGTTIDKYIYLLCRYLPKYFDFKTKISYAQVEHVLDNKDIEHKVIRELLKYFKINKGIELSHLSDIQSRGGTGSSSSFIVGMINTLYKLTTNMELNPYELYKKTIFIEQEYLKEDVGYQDAAWAAFGGFNIFKFSNYGDIEINPILMDDASSQEFLNSLLLFYTGQSRISNAIVSDYTKDEKNYVSIYQIAEESIKYFKNLNIEALGKLMHNSWLEKRNLSNKISNDFINSIYNEAILHGAIGGKLIGAGGGGFLLLICKDKHSIRKALNGLTEVNFKFERKGSHFI